MYMHGFTLVHFLHPRVPPRNLIAERGATRIEKVMGKKTRGGGQFSPLLFALVLETNN